MNQVYHPYTAWECFHAGMYSDVELKERERDGFQEYALFLADIPRFNAAMLRVLSEWPRSCEHFLSNPSVNRIAWLGQSAMCIDTGISRRYRAGFRLLNPEQQLLANTAAEKMLESWCSSGESRQLLLPFA